MAKLDDVKAHENLYEWQFFIQEYENMQLQLNVKVTDHLSN